MYNIEHLLESNKLQVLKKGLTSKETYKLGDVVLGVIKTSRLAAHDQDPLKMCNFIANYIHQLKMSGVPLVDVLDVNRQDETIVIVTRFMQRFLDTEMSTKSSRFISGVHEMLEVLSLIKDTSVGIDPTPKNFAVTNEGIVYTDFFYPFTKQYIDWVRNRIDLNNPQNRYVHFIHDYVFFPKVYAHAVKDWQELGVITPEAVFGLVKKETLKQCPGFNLDKELGYYLEKKSLLRQAVIQTRKGD